MTPLRVALILILTLGMWTAAAAVFFPRPHQRANRLLALVLFVEPLMFGLPGVVAQLLGTQADAYAGMWVFHFATPLWIALYLAFLGTLPSPLSRPLASPAATLLLSGSVVAAWVLFVKYPEMFVQVHDGALAVGPLAAAVRALILVVLVYALVVAVSAWRRAAPGTVRRAQLKTYALAFGARDVLVVLFLVAAMVLLPLVGRTPRAEIIVDVLALLPTLVFLPLLLYGILRTQLFDIDLRIKWTLKQSTVAGAFVASFFLVSEAAATFLGETTGSTYLGIGATAVLVFALAPLQRIAQKLADAAMPGVQDTEDYLTRRKRDIYRAAVESALSDGEVTVKERDVLATLADELGLTAREVLDVERATAAATSAGDA